MESIGIQYQLDDRHLDVWRDVVCDELLEADSPWSSGRSLGVALGVTAIGGVVHLDCGVTHAGLTLARDARRVAKGGHETMGLSVVLTGAAEITTSTGVHVLGAGELCLLSSREIFAKRLSANYREQFLFLPVPLALALGSSVPVMAQRVLVAPRRGLGSVLADGVVSLARECNTLSRAEWNTALRAIFELAAGVFGTPDPEGVIESTREVHHRRALRYIDTNLADPELSPTVIAIALRISPRYLHLLFEAGSSVGATILTKRLDRCRAALLDRVDHRSISEIAFAWGFNDAAHFSRTFKARFGSSPRALRSGR